VVFFFWSTTHDICHSSKRIKDLAQSYGFRGIIAGTRKTTPGIVVREFGVAPRMLTN
jgi:hypothetical protein